MSNEVSAFIARNPSARHKLYSGAMRFFPTANFWEGDETCLIRYDEDLSAALEAAKDEPLYKDLISEIQQHPLVYSPDRVDGFLLERDYMPLLRLQRTGARGDGVTGRVSYNDLRQAAIQAERNAGNIASVALLEHEASGCTVF